MANYIGNYLTLMVLNPDFFLENTVDPDWMVSDEAI